MTSKGLMQVIDPTFDPLANMTASVAYVRAHYEGGWTEETVKPRPEMAEIMERAMVAAGFESGERYASGGVIPSPTGRIKTWLSPGEHVMTPEMARAAADRALDRIGATRFGLPFPTELDEMPEPPDDYPEPPMLPVW